ncbi:ATP-binding protein [Nonomuraea sp. NPDC050202]|uniref:ATP-binding protein n=1 Tax=Nonomuraea sp. NPDC050202 TaxID=3155035 RepID=UPI0033D17C5F
MSTPYEQWHTEQTQHRLARLRAARPAAYNAPGLLHPDIAAWADKTAVGEYGNLVIVGNIGVGKSWSVWTLADRMVAAGYRGRVEIVPARRLQRLITPPVDWTALDRLAKAGMLAIDDVGSVRIGDWDSDQIGALLDPRWEEHRPTILTSNQLDLRSMVGERVASRMSHRVTIVQMAGADRRRTA